MRRIGPTSIAVGLLCCSVAGRAQVSLVHATPCGPQTFPAACAVPATGSGNLIVVGWQIGGGADTSITITGATDNVGNVYAEAGGARSVDSSAASVADIWYAANVSAGATSITIVPSVPVTNGAAVIWEFSGASPVAPLDQTAVLNSQASAAVAVGAALTTTANGVIVSLAPVATNVTGINSGNAFANDSTLKGNGWAHLITTAAGSYSAQWALGGAGTYSSSAAAFKVAPAKSVSPCDLNQDGLINSADLQLAVNMAIGSAPCTANISGSGGCNIVMVQQVVNAALGGACGTVAVSPHSVSLNWNASTSSNVAGYNVYRGSVSGGPYTKVNSSLVVGTTFTDSAVQAAQTYYYVCTAVDTSNNESAYSSPPASATIPTP